MPTARQAWAAAFIAVAPPWVHWFSAIPQLVETPVKLYVGSLTKEFQRSEKPWSVLGA